MKMLGLVSVLIASVGWGNAAVASESAASGNKLPELSLEFFDYLGSLVKRDGEWVDALALDEQFAEDASSNEDAEDAFSKDVASKDAQTKVSEVEQ